MRTTRTGQSYGILATMLVLLTLLAGMAQGQRSYVPIDQPQFLQVELLEAAPLGSCSQAPFYYKDYYGGLRVLKLTYHSGRGLRGGISLVDGGGEIIEGPGGMSVAPIHVGYDIVLNPKKTGFFYGMVPSCYVEATLGVFPLYAKVAAACDIDYYGLGVGAEAGCMTWSDKPQYVPTSSAFHPAIYATLKIRLLDAAFRLPGRR